MQYLDQRTRKQGKNIVGLEFFKAASGCHIFYLFLTWQCWIPEQVLQTTLSFTILATAALHSTAKNV